MIARRGSTVVCWMRHAGAVGELMLDAVATDPLVGTEATFNTVA